MKKRLFVIDGHALCYRAYYAFIKNPLINSQGQNTSAIFGFARMLLKLLDEQKPEYCAVAFDPPKKTFRFDIYPEYKANREKMPDDLRSQISEIKTMVSTLGIAVIEEENFEADDILGTVAAKFPGEDLDVFLVTGDKDANQLVTEDVKIYANKKGISEFEIYGINEIIEKLGIRPEQVIDYMALTGDTSDNIPGVKGVGEKTALQLINDYKTLDNIYDNIDNIKGKLREKLLQDRDNAYLSKKLVTIQTDIPLKVKLSEMLTPEIKTPEAKEYFKKLEMDSILKQIFNEEDDKKAPSEEDKKQKRDYRIIKTEDELENVIKKIKKTGYISIDTETTSTNPLEAELVGISLSIESGSGWYIQVMGESLFQEKYIEKNTIIKHIKVIVEDPDIKKIGQNIKYDLLILQNEGLNMKGIWFDTMVASYLLDPAARRHNMDDMAKNYLDYNTISYEDLVGKGKKAVPITQVPLDRLAEYAIEDADITYRLYKVLQEKLKEENLYKLFHEVEMPLVPILACMESTGVKIDKKHFSSLSVENEKLLKDVEEEIYRISGKRFNINSTKELSEVLFKQLGLKSVRKTKTGQSTDIRVLEALKGKHEIIDHLISYRTLNKLKTTYIDSLPRLISGRTGRIHTSYNQTVVATGRLSSSDPNLQNIPIKDDFGRQIRKGFVPEKGFWLLSADYSQIELRLAAHLSKDENMIKAFKDGIDIHNLTASSVFGVPIDQVTKEMRRQSKIINFATIYGVSPFGLSQQADISIKDASDFIKKYFETYPGFKDYIDSTIAFAREKGYVETLLGRKRPVPDINSDQTFRREGAERVAINTPIQGTSADLIKIAMINIHKKFTELGYKTRMILQVHDELVFEIPEEEKKEAEKLIKIEMEKAMELRVPIIVDMAWGKNWDEAH